MYTLIMIVLIWHGNASFGGPVAVDGFKTKESCEAFAKEYESKLPKSFPRKYLSDTTNSVQHFTCIKKS